MKSRLGTIGINKNSNIRGMVASKLYGRIISGGDDVFEFLLLKYFTCFEFDLIIVFCEFPVYFNAVYI